jgi:hypothetical protein
MQTFEPKGTEKFYGKKIVPSFFGDEEFNEWIAAYPIKIFTQYIN